MTLNQVCWQPRRRGKTKRQQKKQREAERVGGMVEGRDGERVAR
jgi:hypothetical protein